MYGNSVCEVFRHADRLHAGVVQRRSASRGPSARRLAGYRRGRAPPASGQAVRWARRPRRPEDLPRWVARRRCAGGLEAGSPRPLALAIVRILDDLKGRGVAFRSLTEGIDTTTSHGEFLYNLFGTLAQYERSLIRERVNAGLVAARRRGRRGGRPPAIDPETVEQIVAALDSGSSKSAVCRTFKVARSTLNDTLERIGWNGAGQPGSETSKRDAKRPREQERGKRLSREERERASFLRQYLGIEVGVRRSVAQIGEQLPAHDRKNAQTGELVSKIASSFLAEGFAEVAPGPRGGGGLVSHPERQ